MNVTTPACPFCDSRDVELVSAWGGQLITSQLRCCLCNSHFEAVRDDFDSVERVQRPVHATATDTPT